ncbi:hypothetical protein [Geodermatophilus amargosae]|uniref:hypothetical protein n=1 Tax=Geodermatophilus amargosae TaxID=1296565 RepID=UPI001587E509|nr:hypothetical protein [Geodermatophilus amargosae]
MPRPGSPRGSRAVAVPGEPRRPPLRWAPALLVPVTAFGALVAALLAVIDD